MKKIAIILLAVVYLGISTGVVVNKHFCMNQLASMEFFGEPDDTCGRCGMDMHQFHGCCHDEVSMVKLHPDQQPSHFGFDALQLAAIVPTPVYNLSPESFIEVITTPLAAELHPPPLLSESDTYLQNSVFRI